MEDNRMYQEIVITKRPYETYSDRTRRARNIAAILKRKKYDTKQRAGVITTTAPTALARALEQDSK
jgi:hypothetical protein